MILFLSSNFWTLILLYNTNVSQSLLYLLLSFTPQGSLSRALGLRLRDEMNSTAQSQDASSPSASSSSSVGAAPSNGAPPPHNNSHYYYYPPPRRPDSRGMRQSPSVSSSERSSGIRQSPSTSSYEKNNLRQSPSVASSINSSPTVKPLGPSPRGVYGGPAPPQAGLNPRPRSSVVPLPHDASIESHRRVKSIGDIEHVTVTPV